MHFSYTLLALVAAVTVNAQLPNIPPCSQNCFLTALAGDGCASITDFKCACGKPSLVSTITPCVAKACSKDDQMKVQAAVESTCAGVGVPISIPPISGGPSTTTVASSAAPESSAPSSSSSSVAPSSSSSASSSSAPAPTSTSTVAPTIAGPTFTTSTSAAPAPTVAPSSSEANASSTPAAFTGGASHVQGQLGGVAALLFAAAYYL